MTDKHIPQDWTGDEIMTALREVGITVAGIQRDLELKSYSSVYRVIHCSAPSDRVRRHIAHCIKKPVAEIWPRTYLVKKNPTRKGRPRTRGLYTGQAA